MPVKIQQISRLGKYMKKAKHLSGSLIMQKRKSRRKSKKGNELVIIKPLGGHSYTEFLTKLMQYLKPEDVDDAIRSISKSKAGSVLLVLGKGREKGKFRDTIKTY